MKRGDQCGHAVLKESQSETHPSLKKNQREEGKGGTVYLLKS